MVKITAMIPLYCFFACVVIVLLLYIYIRVTCGECNCSVHLINKVVIVTGANSGIGFMVAKDLAERGARVIIACRNEQRAINAVNKIKQISRNDDVHYRHIDLAKFSSIRKFADDILKSEERLDILINNAGTGIGANIKTEDGFSQLIQSNYLGPFLLTSLLIPLLMKSVPSRIINVSSVTHKLVFNFDPNKIHEVPARSNCFTNTFCYFKSKLCTNLWTFELSRRLKGTGVTANCLHPGAVKTNLLNNIDLVSFKQIIPIFLPLFKTPWKGAQTAIYLAVSPELINSSGGYYVDCKLSKSSARSQNIELAQNLWEVTENIVS